MLKKLFSLNLLLVFLLIGCSRTRPAASSSAGGNEGNSEVKDTSSVSPASPSNIFMSASRDYTPSDFNDFDKTVAVGASYTAPSELVVVQGNAGTGWASLTVGARKLCYQGNATNNTTADGTRFVLTREKSDATIDCSSSSFNTAANTTLTLNDGDSVKLHVNGGGCKNNAGTCVYTEVEGELTLN